ncbi:MAG: FxsA family protein [Alphaproteobacteria bacterium]
MGKILFLALVGVPLLEIAVFIQVGGVIGLWPTLAVIVLTAVIGTLLLRQQGLATLGRARGEMAAGRMPVRELFDGVCLLAAGAFLLTPGFVTDAVGFALMVPPLRAILGRWLWQMVATHGHFEVDLNAQVRGRRPGGTVIDGDYHEIDGEPPREDPDR